MIDEQIRDRALGAVLGAAVGDALGAAYEFLSAEDIAAMGTIDMMPDGPHQRDKGAWTDDTAMAAVIVDVAARFGELHSSAAVDAVAAGFQDWFASGPRDCGVHTSRVLGASLARTGVELLRDSRDLPGDRKGGNGSLMRTSPVALAYLGEGQGAAALTAAAVLSDLTHDDVRARQACRLWTTAIRHAVLLGTVQGVVSYLQHYADKEERAFWVPLFQKAEQPDVSAHAPANGWVVDAVVCAWHAIATTPGRGSDHFRQALCAAIRLGYDTDTVACIAGGLLGACWGALAIPQEWRDVVHGYPGWTAVELTQRVDQILSRY